MEQQEIDELKALRSRNQVTSFNQFSDVRPTDLAYQALTNLVEKYGCVAGYPNGTYKGGQARSDHLQLRPAPESGYQLHRQGPAKNQATLG